MKIDNVGIMDLGTEARASLGDRVPFIFYRYMSLFAVADSKGAGAALALFDGGYAVGTQLVKEMMIRDFDGVAEHCRVSGIGILRIESQDGQTTRVRLEECATCSGLPSVEMPLCYFNGGILAGAVQTLHKSTEAYGAREVECGGLGHLSCLFEIAPRSRLEPSGQA